MFVFAQRTRGDAADERGLGRRVKRAVPARWFRAGTITFNTVVSRLPFGFKYWLSGVASRRRAPYRFLSPTDTVVQVGSARDILASGRSRAVQFSRLVPSGRVIVVEADPDNCWALRAVIKAHQLMNITVLEKAAWWEPTQLTFFSNSNHPAANLVAGVKDIESTAGGRGYVEHTVSADTLDNVLTHLHCETPVLVSITTNGAEVEVLQGATKILNSGCRFVSLASTRPDLVEHMRDLGYDCIAHDDRGYCFERIGEHATARPPTDGGTTKAP